MLIIFYVIVFSIIVFVLALYLSYKIGCFLEKLLGGDD